MFSHQKKINKAVNDSIQNPDQSKSVAIINYGMGNLRSVLNAFLQIGVTATIIDSPDQIQSCTHLVLPGVGSFGDAMENLNRNGWSGAIRNSVVDGGKYFLGICLGIQLIASSGTENGEHAGLDIVRGRVERIPVSPGIRIPHIGWNEIEKVENDAKLFAGIDNRECFYFIHSYVLVPEDESIVKAVTYHGTRLVCAIQHNNIWATQFHPEKSQKAGLQILRNFVEQA